MDFRQQGREKLFPWYDKLYDMIYLLTASGLSTGGRSTVHIYTNTIHRTIQKKQYIEEQGNYGRLRAVPRPLCRYSSLANLGHGV
jgi:hypothetical protein